MQWEPGRRKHVVQSQVRYRTRTIRLVMDVPAADSR
jgi:hypothetical protein